MTWRQFVPKPLKVASRPARRRLKAVLGQLSHRPNTRDELLVYWRDPPDAGNAATAYAESGHERSAFLVDLVKRHLATEASVLEIGCNAGRNLDHLYRAGFTKLTGVEISERAIAVFRDTYPETAQSTEIQIDAIENAVGGFTDGQFDLVFTMAVLEHVHKISAWVFPEIARVTGKLLITVEDERTYGTHHFPRNYQKVFEALGMEQIERIHPFPDLSVDYVGRVFQPVKLPTRRRSSEPGAS